VNGVAHGGQFVHFDAVSWRKWVDTFRGWFVWWHKI
jgi:hypothetical protein